MSNIRIYLAVLACWVESLAQSIEWQHCLIDSGICLRPDPEENPREGAGHQQKLQKLKISCLPRQAVRASRLSSCGSGCRVLKGSVCFFLADTRADFPRGRRKPARIMTCMRTLQTSSRHRPGIFDFTPIGRKIGGYIFCTGGIEGIPHLDGHCIPRRA